MRSLGKGIPEEDKAKSKAIKLNHCWCVQGTPKESVWLEESKETEREKVGKSEWKRPNPVR